MLIWFPKKKKKKKKKKKNNPWNVERLFLEDLLLVVKGQSYLEIDGYL